MNKPVIYGRVVNREQSEKPTWCCTDGVIVAYASNPSDAYKEWEHYNMIRKVKFPACRLICETCGEITEQKGHGWWCRVMSKLFGVKHAKL